MRIQLIEDLTQDRVPAGFNLLVVFDPTSLWYEASFTITVGWIKSGGKLNYNVFSQPPDNIRVQLKRLGLDTDELEKTDKLRITDWYSATLGQKSKEKSAISSLKVADLSIIWSREVMRRPPNPELLRITDNTSNIMRAGDEKAWTEYLLTRVVPSGP